MSKSYEITGGHSWLLYNHTFNPRSDMEDAEKLRFHNGDVVTYAGWTSSYHVLVKALYANKWFLGIIPTQNLKEVVPVTPPAPVDRTQWREGIEAVQAYLPCINPDGHLWSYLKGAHYPLYDGLRKMQHNGPDND